MRRLKLEAENRLGVGKKQTPSAKLRLGLGKLRTSLEVDVGDPASLDGGDRTASRVALSHSDGKAHRDEMAKYSIEF